MNHVGPSGLDSSIEPYSDLTVGAITWRRFAPHAARSPNPLPETMTYSPNQVSARVGTESGSDRIRKTHWLSRVPLDPVATALGSDTTGALIPERFLLDWLSLLCGLRAF